MARNFPMKLTESIRITNDSQFLKESLQRLHGLNIKSRRILLPNLDIVTALLYLRGENINTDSLVAYQPLFWDSLDKLLDLNKGSLKRLKTVEEVADSFRSGAYPVKELLELQDSVDRLADECEDANGPRYTGDATDNFRGIIT